MTDDPFKLLAMPDTLWPPGVDPVPDAVRRFDPENPAPLLELLESSDWITRRRGLRVFADLGRKGATVLDSALELAGHPFEMARFSLMDGLMSHIERLTSAQLSRVLPLANDPFALTRHKVMVVLAVAELETLRSAILLLDDPLRCEHLRDFDLLRAEPSNIQPLFDAAVVRQDVWAAYALASLERMVRQGMLDRPPEYSGDEYVGEAVVAQLKRLIARRNRATEIRTPS